MRQPTAENATQHEIVHDLKGPRLYSSCHGKRPMDVRRWVGKFLGRFHRGKMTLFTIILENFFCHLRQSILFFLTPCGRYFSDPFPPPLLSAIFSNKNIYIATSFRFCSVAIYYLYIYTE